MGSDVIHSVATDEDTDTVDEIVVGGSMNGEFDRVKTGMLLLLLLFCVW